jgi:hypothetical protein
MPVVAVRMATRFGSRLLADGNGVRSAPASGQSSPLQVGRSLADWLRVPLLDEGTADVPPLKSKKIMFRQGW